MAKLIWIDDEVDLLKPHIVFLENKGYQVTPVNNVNEALEMIEKLQEAGIVVALDRQEIAAQSDRRSAAQAVAAEAGVPVLAVAGLADLLAFADGSEKLAVFRAPLLAYRVRYGCDPTG